jgi:DNA-binding CsgD family transcriptional regulator
MGYARLVSAIYVSSINPANSAVALADISRILDATVRRDVAGFCGVGTDLRSRARTRTGHSSVAALRHGLTPADAQVGLRISGGAGPRQIAGELSVSNQTVRTHLQHVFDNTDTDTHRQGELIGLLLDRHPLKESQ